MKLRGAQIDSACRTQVVLRPKSNACSFREGVPGGERDHCATV